MTPEEKLKALTSDDSNSKAIYDWIQSKDDEIQALRTRCALLDSLLSEALRHGYIDTIACSPASTRRPSGLKTPLWTQLEER